MRKAIPLFLAALVLGAACAPLSDPPSRAEGDIPIECVKGKMPTVAAGKLTVAAEVPRLRPYFFQDNPENGQGFEAALAYAVAGKLGYGKDDVDWVDMPFGKATTPGPKPFDFDINEFTITPEREEQIDFSEPYLTNYQTVVVADARMLRPTPALSDLRGLKIGVQVGTTSFSVVERQVRPSQPVAVFNEHSEVKAALRAGQIQAMVTDLGLAVDLANFEQQQTKVFGKIMPPDGERPETFGMLFDSGSPLVACVNQALAILVDERVVTRIARTAGPAVPDGPAGTLENDWLLGANVLEIAND